MTFTPDGDRVIVASGRRISVWTTDGKRVSAFDAGGDVIWGVAVSPDGNTDRNGERRPDRVDSGARRSERRAASGSATPASRPTSSFSSDGETLITTSRTGEVRFWDRRSGQLLGEPFKASANKIGEVWRVA